MVPVFDISLIGTLTAIWTAAKVIFSTLGRGLDWIAKKALTLLIGNKLWATLFFAGLAVSCIGAFNWLIGVAVSHVVNPDSLTLGFDNQTLVIMSYLFDLESLVSFLQFSLSLLVSYLTLTKVRFVFRAMLRLYQTISTAWKV